MKFQSKPEHIEAEQFLDNDESLHKISEMLGGMSHVCWYFNNHYATIHTVNGTKSVYKYDFVIKRANGDHEVVKDEDFFDTYEKEYVDEIL